MNHPSLQGKLFVYLGENSFNRGGNDFVTIPQIKQLLTNFQYSEQFDNNMKISENAPGVFERIAIILCIAARVTKDYNLIDEYIEKIARNFSNSDYIKAKVKQEVMKVINDTGRLRNYKLEKLTQDFVNENRIVYNILMGLLVKVYETVRKTYPDMRLKNLNSREFIHNSPK